METNNEITIKYDNLRLLVEGSKMITINPTGEEILMKLLELKEKVENAINQSKSIIQSAMLDIDPDLSSISSDNLRVIYRAYGDKYCLDSNCIDYLDEKLYKAKMTYTPISAEIDKVIKETGAVPNGVIVKDRNKIISITLKNKVEEGVIE